MTQPHPNPLPEGEGRGEGTSTHSTILTHPGNQFIHAVNARGDHNQHLAERNSMAQAFVAHLFIGDGVDIRNMREAHAAANQLGTAEADRVRPHLF